MSILYEVRSNPALHFTAALAQNAVSAMISLPGVPRIGPLRVFIRALSLVTKERYGPDVNFFSSATGFTTNPATDTFLSRFTFTAAMAQQLGGSGLWRYYVDGMGTPYYDRDTINTTSPPLIHIKLGNVEATGKSAGSDGSTVLTVWLEPFGVQP
jgi:hypothetical protein